MDNVFSINENIIAPGEQGVVKLTVARLTSGTRIHLQVHVFRSEQPGPTVLVSGGIHGDEINGVEIVRRSMELGIFDMLIKGTVVAVPLVNIYGFLHFSRDTPDGKDINRSFPGSISGSLSSRVARTFTKHVLPVIDFGVDFHTGGAQRYNYPQIRYTRDDKRAEELAKQFNAPLLLPKSAMAKTLRREANKKGKPILVYEGGEALRLDGFTIEHALHGLRRLLHANGMLDSSPAAPINVNRFEKMTWLRARRSGMFEWTRQSGNWIKKGDILGYIRDPYGQYDVPVVGKRDGYIIGHNNAPVVSQGDALFNIGY